MRSNDPLSNAKASEPVEDYIELKEQNESPSLLGQDVSKKSLMQIEEEQMKLREELYRTFGRDEEEETALNNSSVPKVHTHV